MKFIASIVLMLAVSNSMAAMTDLDETSLSTVTGQITPLQSLSAMVSQFSKNNQTQTTYSDPFNEMISAFAGIFPITYDLTESGIINNSTTVINPNGSMSININEKIQSMVFSDIRVMNNGVPTGPSFGSIEISGLSMQAKVTIQTIK